MGADAAGRAGLLAVCAGFGLAGAEALTGIGGAGGAASFARNTIAGFSSGLPNHGIKLSQP